MAIDKLRWHGNELPAKAQQQASNARPYSLVGSADKDRTHGKRGKCGFLRTLDTVFTQKPYP